LDGGLGMQRVTDRIVMPELRMLLPTVVVEFGLP
jgi:hypothetical protein